jgi:SAM-dependent methyltransferase
MLSGTKPPDLAVVERPDQRAVVEAYDTVAGEYARQFADELDRKPFDRQLLDGFVDMVAGRGSACDVGCGPGQVAAYLATRGVAAFGLDLSGATVATARGLHPELAFVRGDVLSLPTKNGGWAGATAFYSLIHLPRGRLPAALRELRRALAPSAPLLLAMHGGDGEHIATEFLGQAVQLTAVLYRLDELTSALTGAGFSVESATSRDPYPFEFPSPRLYVRASRADDIPGTTIRAAGAPTRSANPG